MSHTTFSRTATRVSNPGASENASSLMMGNVPCGCNATLLKNMKINFSSDQKSSQCITLSIKGSGYYW